MFGIGPTELVVFLIIVLIIFGPKNLPRLARALGQSMRELKEGMHGISNEMKDGMHTPSEKTEGRREPPQPTTGAEPKAEPTEAKREEPKTP
jgi:sec-independent protein translocase protein TatA